MNNPARMKVLVRDVTAGSMPGSRAARMTVGALALAGWWTAVLDSTTPANWSTCRSAQPNEMGPPQSWATGMIGPVLPGPVRPSASVSESRSSTRWASGRTVPVRSENPMSRWSIAITRQPSGGWATSRRHR